MGWLFWGSRYKGGGAQKKDKAVKQQPHPFLKNYPNGGWLLGACRVFN